jgi:hypothetical protein
MVWVLSSASCPAISTPVGPPPTITTVNRRWESDCPAMISMLPKIVSRLERLSPGVHRHGVFRAPGIPKWFVVIPLPMIK